MTYLGTRPPTVDEWDKYELHHRARLATKPGLTGMWQVSGRSNITDLHKWTHKEEAMLSLTATYDEFESLITKQHSYELFETIIEKKRKESQKIYIDALKSCEV